MKVVDRSQVTRFSRAGLVSVVGAALAISPPSATSPPATGTTRTLGAEEGFGIMNKAWQGPK